MIPKLKLIRDRTFPENLHRSGWNEVVRVMRNQLHCDDALILMDDCIEATFGWETQNTGKHTTEWIGIIHLPIKMPPPFHKHSSPFDPARSNVRASLSTCRGLFTLSKKSQNEICNALSERHFRIQSLLHPTPLDVPPFNFNTFQVRPRVLQLGWWLRRFSSFYLLQTAYEKIILMGQNPHGEEIHAAYLSEIESKFGKMRIRSENYLENHQYDSVLSASVVFLDLIDCSASNAVIECIARGTPLLVNRLAPLEEYLGEEYPLFYESLNEAASKLHNPALLRAASEYLLHSPIRKRLTYEHFVKSIVESRIYEDL